MGNELFGKQGFVQAHTVVCATAFILYIPLTLGLLIENGMPSTGMEMGIVGWGLFAGLAPNMFWPTIIREQRKRIERDGR